MKEKNPKLRPIRYSIFSCSGRYYLTHPWKFVRDARVGVKNFWMRAKCGFAWIDLWNMDLYLSEVIANMLEQLAARSCGWPQCEDWPEFENWQEELRAAEKAIRIGGEGYLTEEDWNSAARPLYEENDGSRLDYYRFTQEEKDSIAAETNCYMRIVAAQKILKHKIFVRMERLWETLWD